MTADGWARRLLPPPRRRPGLLATLVRWRTEVVLVLLGAAVWHYAGGAALGGIVTLLAVLTAFVPPVRAVVRNVVQAAIVMHRIRSGFQQAGVADRSGRLPWVVSATARNELVLVDIWLNSGTIPDDVRAAARVLATACGAAKVEVHQRSLRQDRVVIAVYRPRWGWPTR